MEGVKIINQITQNTVERLNNSINDVIGAFIHKHYEWQTLSKQQMKSLFTVKTFDNSQQRHILHKNDLIAIVDLVLQLQKGHYEITIKRFFN